MIKHPKYTKTVLPAHQSDIHVGPVTVLCCDPNKGLFALPGGKKVKYAEALNFAEAAAARIRDGGAR